MSLSITPDGGGAITFADPTTAFTGTVGQYLLSCGRIGNQNYGSQMVQAAGVDGSSEKSIGFRSRVLEAIEVVYVAASADACVAAWIANDAAMNAKSCAVSMLGQSFAACRKRIFRVVKPPIATSQNGRYRMHCELTLEQIRNS